MLKLASSVAFLKAIIGQRLRRLQKKKTMRMMKMKRRTTKMMLGKASLSLMRHFQWARYLSQRIFRKEEQKVINKSLVRTVTQMSLKALENLKPWAMKRQLWPASCASRKSQSQRLIATPRSVTKYSQAWRRKIPRLQEVRESTHRSRKLRMKKHRVWRPQQEASTTTPAVTTTRVLGTMKVVVLEFRT